MGSKGSQTVQQNTNQQQTYSPNPQAYGAISGALGQAQNVAQTPFSTPAAPVAGFSPQQQQAFDITGQAAGYAQPFINQAQQYFSPQGTQQFLNPYTANVSANLQDIFGQQNSQNNGQLTQAAGGVGADRIAVGQSELAKQQGLAAGQTFAGLYNNAAQQAQTAGFGTANLGTAGQNAQLQGAQALLGTGGLQQQLQQAQLNSPYQQQLQQIAWPYQNAQFLSGITGALAPGLGGTTTGVGGNGTTYPGASPWGSIAGLGLTGLGVYGAGQKAGWWGGTGGNTPSDTSGGGGLDGSARGGRINPYFAGGGATEEGGDGVPSMASGSDPTLRLLEANQLEANGRSAPGGGPIQLPPGFDSRSADMSPQSLVPDGKIAGIQPHIPQLNMSQAPQQQSAGGGKGAGMGDVASAAMKILPMVLALKRGGAVANKSGEDESDDDLRQRSMQGAWDRKRDEIDQESGWGPDQAIMPGKRIWDQHGMNRDIRQLARGGPTNPYAFADGGSPSDRVAGAFGALPASPYDPGAYNQLQDYGASLPDYEGSGAPAAHMAEIPSPRSRPDDAPTADVAGGDELPDEAAPAAGVTSPYSGLAGPAPERRNRDHGFVDSPWAALLSAGLGTLAAAGTRDAHGLPTPALAAIGQGGQLGLKTLEGQRASAQKQQSIEQEAQKLDQAARQHLDQYTKMKPFEEAQIGLKKEELGYKKNLLGAGLFDQEALDTMAQSYRAGNTTVIQQVGRGTQGPINLSRFWNTVQKQMESAGANGGDLAAAKANFMGQSAAMRTAAQRGANIDMSIAEAERTFPLAEEASKNLPRGQFVPWNKAVQMVQAGTSSPQLAQLVTAIQGARTAYSQAMSRTGVNTVHAQQNAEELLSRVTSHESLVATLGQMKKEMEAAKAAPEVVRQAIEARISGHAAPAAAPAAPSAPGGGGADPLAQARAAIAGGAPRDAVIKRLQERGVDPAGL